MVSHRCKGSGNHHHRTVMIRRSGGHWTKDVGDLHRRAGGLPNLVQNLKCAYPAGNPLPSFRQTWPMRDSLLLAKC